MRQEEPIITDAHTTGIMTHIKEGMTVNDAEGIKIGKVKSVHFGDETDSKPGPETITTPADPSHDTFIEDIARAFTGNDMMPEAVKARLLRYGFLRIDQGLLQRDAVVTPDQILQVKDNQVVLNILSDELVGI